MSNKINYINISYDELCKLKKIGYGTDSKVFKYNGSSLLKIYRQNLYYNQKDENNRCAKDKIYDKNTIKIININENINYYQYNEDDEVKLRTKDSVLRAISKQKYINRTELPKGVVYIDNKFSGVILKKLNGIQIHKLSGFPLNYKYKIIKNVLLDIEELLNNYIYHIDLDNSPYQTICYIDKYEQIKFIDGHSHILVEFPTCKTNLIDLDCKSTIYRERYDEINEYNCIAGLCTLIIEFLFGIDTKEIQKSDEIYFELLKIKLNKELSRKLAYHDFNNFQEMKKLFIKSF